MPEPGVIVLAVFRPNPSLLRRQVRSIIDQSLQDWHCIIGIDGPDEAAATLVHDAVAGDSRFEVVRFPQNVGIYLNFERLLTRIGPCTPWVALADQDDYWHESKLEVLVSTLEAEGVSGVSCQARLTSPLGLEGGRTARKSKPLIPLLILNEVTGGLTIFRFEVVALALPFPPPTRRAIHDHWLGMCAISLRGHRFTDKVLQDYVQHEGNAIGEPKKLSLPTSLAHLLCGRASWDEITDPWQWRVTMARTLGARTSLPESEDLATIAHGRLTVRLVRLMFRQVLSRQVPAFAAAAMSVAAARRTSRTLPSLRDHI